MNLKILVLFVVFVDLVCASVWAKAKLVDLSSYEDDLLFTEILPEHIYLRTGLYSPEDFHLLPISNLHPEINTEVNPYSILAAKAFFLIPKPKDFKTALKAMNNPKVIGKVYDAKSTKLSDEEFKLAKKKLFLTITFKVLSSLYLEEPKNFPFLNETLNLDKNRYNYIGSAVHNQKEFSRMFNGGEVITNFYHYNEQILVSAYSLLYVRDTAIKKLDKLLFFSSAEKSFQSELKDQIQTIYKVLKESYEK